MNIDNIQEDWPSICYSCNNARKTWAEELHLEGYVGCCGRAIPYPYTFDYDVIKDGETIAEGWVDLGCSPFNKCSGIFTNFQLITRMIKICKKYNKI